MGVGYLINPQDILASQAGSGMVTADAMAKAFNSSIMSKVLIVGGMCGIVTSWNSFLIGGSRAMYSMAESYMIPRFFVKLHKKYKTPVNALYLIGALSVLAPFCGRKMLVWIVDAGNFGCCLAYCMVAISFIILRKKEPDMARPYKVKHYKIVGVIAVLMSGLMVAMYVIPNSGCTLVWQEVCMAGGWCLLGLVFCIACKLKYKEKFGSHIDVAIDDSELEEKTDDLSVRVEKAINTVKVKEAWEKITLASTIGGMVINTAGVTLAHGMEYPASGLKNIVHGQGLAALTPTIIEASYKGNRDKFGKIARIFGGLTAEDCSMKIRTLLKKLDLECKLSNLGITEEDIPWMAENCMKVSAASVKNNPIVFTKEEIAEIYKKAL